MLTLSLTALSIVRKREVGTIEALLVTPLRPVGVFVFGVPFMGNPWLFIGLCILFAFSGLALGTAISVISQTQMQAQLLALIRKETTQIIRDRRGLALFLGLAFLQLFLYAYAVNTSVYHIPLAVADQSNGRKSREFVQALVNSQYFDVAMELQNEKQVIDAIDRGAVKAGLVIPPNLRPKPTARRQLC